jgi:4-alpha-glucanotransferase
VHPDSYDVWRERESFAFGASVGAPPDPTFTRGQHWGFPPLHPERLRDTKYRYFIDYIRFQMRHTGLLRIDHVMGLHRLYWIPKGHPASGGAYVSYRAEELYAIVSLESHRNKTILVGENLGTVPPEVNAAMSRRHLRQTYVVQYELPKLRPPPVQSVASLNTHDMPPFAAFLRGDDIRDRHKLGLISNGKLRAGLQARSKLVEALARTRKCSSNPRALLQAVLRWLAASPAELALINIEDLWLETLPQNVPGTSTERPNWRRKTRLSLEQIKADRTIQTLLEVIARQRQELARRRP